MAVIARDNVTGLIYAGGRATRMGGVDKGLELFRGRPLIEAVIDRLKPQCASIVISANRNLERYAAWGYPVVRDLDDAFAGPLAALAAAGAQSVVMTEWVLTAPCDAPALSLSTHFFSTEIDVFSMVLVLVTVMVAVSPFTGCPLCAIEDSQPEISGSTT